MKIHEIILEAKSTKLHPDHDAAHPGEIIRARDVGGYDRIYHMNRMMMAMASADGKSTKPVDSPADTWFEKYNTIHPYTKEENNMAKSAMKTIPTDGKVVSKNTRSREAADTHKTSPVPQNSGHRGKKPKK
jgi:hypothetical protein